MRKICKTRIAYGLALTLMAANLSAIQALAEDAQTTSSEDHAPLMQDNSTQPQTENATVKDTTRVLGTLPAGDAVPLPSSASNALPQPQQFGDIAYITGGFGDEERNTLEAEQKDYNLRVMAANKAGQFLADTHIVIRDHTGHEILDAIVGPLFYARLPAGSYTVEASNEGQTRKQNVAVDKRKPSTIHFSL